MDERYPGLLARAKRAAARAYAPYSGFRVGACALAASGAVYEGANVENVSFGGTICAERVAAAAAVSAGERSFVVVAVWAERDFTTPCGICRQFLAEFGDMDIVMEKNGEPAVMRLSALLPAAFREF